MHPYRDPPAAPRRAAPPASDDRTIAAVIALVGLVRVAPALFTGEPFEAELTIALLLVVIGAVGMVRGGRT